MELLNSLDLAVVGNCTWGGLIDRRARLVWACMPRFDSDPLSAVSHKEQCWSVCAF